MLVLLIFSVLVLLILVGFPIAVAMGLTAVGFFLGLGEPRMIGAMAQRMYSAVSSFPLLAIPFFILAGNLMNSGGMTDRIFGFARTLVGHVRGGLAHVSVLASMMFAGVSGAALAEAMGLGVIEIKAMKDGGFDKTFAGAVVASSSTIGPVIPPSIPMVIYGALAEVSVGKLFLGGVIPGVMMGIGIMIIIYILSVKRGYRAEQRATLAQVMRSGIDGILGLLAPGIIMGGILGGVFTPTEAAVAAVIYAMVVGCLVYRELDLTRLYGILWDTVDQTVRVMFIIAAAGMFGWLLIYIRAPQAIVEGLTSLTSSPVVILLILNVILLVLGCFMEGIAIMLLTVPIFMPVLVKFGIDPVHFGVVMTLNLMIGLLTPPVGMVLYAVSTIAQVPVIKLAWELVPFMVILGVVLILITYIPGSCHLAADSGFGSRHLTRLERYIGFVLRAVSVCLLVGILVLMVANVSNRFVNFAKLDWNDEVIELMLVWLIFCGSAEVWRLNQHFAVDLVPLMIEGTRFDKYFKAFISFGCLAFIAIFTYRSFDLFQRATDVSPYFSWPRRLWYGAMPFNGALMVGFSVRQLTTILLTPAAEFAPKKAVPTI